jgi:hypothetical protein
MILTIGGDSGFIDNTFRKSEPSILLHFDHDILLIICLLFHNVITQIGAQYPTELPGQSFRSIHPGILTAGILMPEALGNKEDARQLNTYLDTIKLKVQKARRLLIEENKPINALRQRFIN